MPLVLKNRAVGDVTVITCTGRIVDGEECADLDAHVGRLLPLQPDIVLNLAGVEFVDSAGLGLLIKLSTRARGRDGSVKLCGLRRHIREVLRVTKLFSVLEAYDTEAEAIASFYSPPVSGDAEPSFDVDILCVHPSADVLAYIREVLRQAGYGVATATNISDAGILLRATRPKVVVVADELGPSLAESAQTEGSTSACFVSLPLGFSTEDPGDAAKQLVADVAGALASR